MANLFVESGFTIHVAARAANGPGTRCKRPRKPEAGTSAGDQALALELAPGLLERDIGRGQDDVGPHQLVVIDGVTLGADVVEQAPEDITEGLLVAGLATGDGLVVQLVQSGGIVVG